MIYTCVKYQGKTPMDYQYTFKKMRDRKVKQVFLVVVKGISGRVEGTRKG
jgi:hypothetical protein